MWVGLLKNKTASERSGQLGKNMLKQSNLMGMMPSAAFAKFDRSKPHINVGTIGK
jgi:hypothetical protein